MAQVRRLGPKAGSHLALFCIYRMNSCNDCSTQYSVDVEYYRLAQHIVMVDLLVMGLLSELVTDW